MKKILKFLIIGSSSFLLILLFTLSFNVIKNDWLYGHKSLYTFQEPFDWFNYKLKTKIIKSIINLRENNKQGLPIKKIYIDEKLQNGKSPFNGKEFENILTSTIYDINDEGEDGENNVMTGLTTFVRMLDNVYFNVLDLRNKITLGNRNLILQNFPNVDKEIEEIKDEIIGVEEDVFTEDKDIFEEALQDLGDEFLDKELLEEIKQYDFGIVGFNFIKNMPREKKLYLNAALGNKLFDYLFAGIPVVTINADMMAKFTIKNNCGYVKYKNKSWTETVTKQNINFDFKSITTKYCMENQIKKLELIYNKLIQ